MATPSQLSPEAVGKLARRLFGKEQFKADPAGSILRAIEWLDQAAADSGETNPPERSVSQAGRATAGQSEFAFPRAER